MAKRTLQGDKTLFNFNFESLLLSDYSQEDRMNLQICPSGSPKYSKKPRTADSKKVVANKIRTRSSKISDNLSGTDNEDAEESNDANFFENVGHDIKKFIKVRKTRMENFSEALISLYQTKIADMIKRQEAEVEQFKEGTVNSIEEEIRKYEEESKKLRQQENKLARVLEQQLRVIQKASTVQQQFLENFSAYHRNFFQAYEELKIKHKSEALELKLTLGMDISKLQNKFLTESKKEEMQTMKKYLSSVYF